MKRQIQAVSLLLGLALSVLVTMAAAEDSSPPPKPKPKAAAKPSGPPVTRKDNVTDTINGVEIVDPYRWLENQQSPETRKWITAQNTYTQSQLGTRPTLPELRARLGGLMRTERMSVPIARDGKYYFSLQRANQDLATICRRASASGETQVLVDPMPMSKDHTTSVALMDVSRNGARMAYSVRRGGTDEVEIRVRNADAPRDLPDTLKYGLYGSVSLTPDGAGMYYAKRNRDTGGRIYFHEIGSKVVNDIEVFGNGFGKDVWVNAQLSDDGRHVLYSADHGWGRSEIYVGGIAPDSKIEPIVTDIDAHFNCTMVGDRILVHTDWKAPKYRLMLADMDQPAPTKWREIVPEGKDVLQDVTYIGGKIYARYLHDVVTEIKTFTLNGEPTGNVTLPGIGSASVSGEPDGKEAFITYTSFTTPPTTFRDDVKTGDRDVWSKSTVDVDPEQFAVEQVWYTSKDSTTRVPMFLVHKKGLEDRRQPSRAALRLRRLQRRHARRRSARTAVAFAERGGVFALANIRGGGEFGEAWHKAGMLANKQNVFDDFMRRRRVADRQPLHDAANARDPGRQQRRTVGRRVHDAAARALPRRAVPVPRPGHGSLLPVQEQQPARAARVRQRERPRAVQVSRRVLAVPEREGRHPVPRRHAHERRRRHARAAFAGEEDDCAVAGRDDVKAPRAAALRHARRARGGAAARQGHRRHGAGDGVSVLAAGDGGGGEDGDVAVELSVTLPRRKLRSCCCSSAWSRGAVGRAP